MISQDLKNIADGLMNKAANDTLTPTELFKGLILIKEKAKDLKEIENSIIINKH